MKQTLAYGGWVVAAGVAIVWAVFQSGGAPALPSEVGSGSAVELARGSIPAISERVQRRLETDVVQLEEQLTRANLEIARLEERLRESDRPASSSVSADPESASQESDAVSLAADQGKDADTSQSNPLGTPAALDTTSGLAEMSANLTFNMHYAPLLAQLQLDPDRSQAARDIIVGVIAEQTASGLLQLGGQQASPNAYAGDFEQWLIDELAGVLTQEELDQFVAFQDSVEGGSMALQMDSALALQAPGLSADDRAVVCGVLIEEIGTSAASSNAGRTPLQVQIDAYNRASERLAELFEPADYAVVQQFLRQQQASLEMAVRLMNPEKPKSVSL